MQIVSFSRFWASSFTLQLNVSGIGLMDYSTLGYRNTDSEKKTSRPWKVVTAPTEGHQVGET